MITFSHAGDAGDVLYALPTIKALCERDKDAGRLLIRQSDLTRVRQGQALVDFMKPLILATQPHIKEMDIHRGEPVRYDLDRWRYQPSSYAVLTRTLAESAALPWGLGASLFRKPWISLNTQPVSGIAVVIHRSARYHNPLFPWKEVLDRYHTESDGVSMVGTRQEYDDMVTLLPNEMRNVEFKVCGDMLQMANCISRAELFIGNQSAPFALAEAMKKPVIQETSLELPNCIFKRSHAQHVTGESVELWDLKDLPDLDS